MNSPVEPSKPGKQKTSANPSVAGNDRETEVRLPDDTSNEPTILEPVNATDSFDVKSLTGLSDIPRQFGRYLIQRELGRGGMGAVYLAQDQQLGRMVALKIPLFRTEDESGVERFYREARAMATLQHANLCPVFDVGKFEQWHFMTMAFIDGEPLSQYLEKRESLSCRESISLLKTVAMAVHKAHETGIVHRDLKPSNIMLTRELDPIVMDFGLARVSFESEDKELTQSGIILGSPSYMAPEQVEARHHDIGPATDVYALGVTLFQVLTGKKPFDGSKASIFGQIISRLPDAPSKFVESLPQSLDAICLKALSKSPGERHASAAEFASDLSKFASEFGKEETHTHLRHHQARSVAIASEPDVPSSVREAELRQVTVAVFNFDPGVATAFDDTSKSNSEILHEQSREFSSIITQTIVEFGGVQVESSGQEVIGCFGFPKAYEDAPQRAVRVGLKLMQYLIDNQGVNSKLPSPDQAWVTIHSGEAVAGEYLGPNGRAVSLVGNARNMVGRLDAVAEPGAIAISSDTYQRVSLFFECESLGERRARGLPHPVELFRVTQEAASRNRVELVDPGNLTPLIGRNTELTILKDRWEQAIDEMGQIVLLIGSAGLGKSRLIREIREHVSSDESENAVVIELRCSQYHQGTGYFPIVEHLSKLLGFEQIHQTERIDAIIQYLQELEIETTDNVPLLCRILNVPTDDRFPPLELSPQKLRERSEQFFRTWLARLSELGPVLLIVEDLHWLDRSTLEFLETYVDEFETGRVLCLMTFRPEFETPWKSKPHQTQIALNRLTKRQVGEMMRERTSRSHIPDSIIKQIIDRTDGIPLFIEEFSVVIVESGLLDCTDEIESDSTLLDVIPATLNDLLLSRLDRIDANGDVIHIAATIGREFGIQLLSESCELADVDLQRELQKLVKAEILFQKGQGDSAAYIFKHALLQDAAYRSMLTKKRQECHGKIGDVLENSFPEVVQSQPELLAQHFTEAGIVEKAISYWLKAGQRSQEQSSDREAVRQLEKGLDLVMTLSESVERDGLEMGFKLPLSAALMGVSGYAAPEVEPLHNRCIEIARQLGKETLFTVLVANWPWLFVRCRFDLCDERCPDLIAMAEELNGPGMKAEAHWTQACTSMYAGQFQTAYDHSLIGWENHDPQASSEFTKITQQNVGPLNLSNLGLTECHLGLVDRGIENVFAALDLSIQIKHVFTQVVMEWMVAQIHEFTRIGDKVVEYGTRCCKLSEEQGFAFYIGMGMSIKGAGLKLIGRFEDAIDTLSAGITQLESTGALICRPKYKGHLADALWKAGRKGEAISKLDEAFEDQKTGEYSTHAELLRYRGDFARDEDRLDEAEAFYHDSIAVAQSQRSKLFELRSTLWLCQLWKQQGQTSRIREKLEPLVQGMPEGFQMPDYTEATELLKLL